MTGEVELHQTNTEMIQSPPPEVYAGVDIALKVKVSCPEGCNLQAGNVGIVDSEGPAVREMELTEFDGATNGTDEFVVRAPIEPGEYTWMAVFPEQEKEGVLHEESSAPFSFIVKPHATSIAVWDVRSPIVLGDGFAIKVGVKCAAGCSLVGHKIEIFDQEVERVATDKLGDTTWAATAGLYWAEVKLQAPGTEGYYSWEARFPTPDLDLPHEEASYSFNFTTGREPEHVVTVEVIERGTKGPLKSAQVRLRSTAYPYTGSTDEGGVAKLEVPKGEYKIYVSKSEYKDFQTTAEVAGDLTIRAELSVDPLAY